MWEQAGDGLHHAAQVLASAEHGTLDSAGNGAMMAKRIHFTAEDLARTRVKTTLGVAAETVDGVKRLRERDRAPALRGWRTSVTSGLGGSLREQALPLMALMPAQGPQIDIATLTGGATGIDEAVDNLLTASPAMTRLEVEYLDVHPAHRGWARALADGDRGARRELAKALRACHTVAVAPYWAQMHLHLASTRDGYMRTMAEDGVEGLLETVGAPLVRWRPPVLEVRHPHDADIHLRGRGLVIAPTVFSSRQVELLHNLADPEQPPILALPTAGGEMNGSAQWLVGESAEGALEDLVGRTRAAVLATVADGCSTTELARRLRISPATASQHASVLRRAALITTRRDGKAVLHTTTRLGASLLAATNHGFGP
ncbi:ArsR/SmtB family transcription factor [Streptomyces sp. NPDC058869]|uniref:ArsR/SmtB family transcription factor n=2 Tax=unclassified Streptomyces TaxID=2593676 RepID=UPI0036AE44C2